MPVVLRMHREEAVSNRRIKIIKIRITDFAFSRTTQASTGRANAGGGYC